MPKAVFVILRILTGIASFGAFAATLLVLFIIAAAKFVKEGAGVAVSLARSVVSGFTKSGNPHVHQSYLSPGLCALAALFLCMFASVFLPTQRTFLHAVSAFAILAALYRLWIVFTVPQAQVLYLPVIALWLIFYAAALYRA